MALKKSINESLDRLKQVIEVTDGKFTRTAAEDIAKILNDARSANAELCEIALDVSNTDPDSVLSKKCSDNPYLSLLIGTPQLIAKACGLAKTEFRIALSDETYRVFRAPGRGRGRPYQGDHEEQKSRPVRPVRADRKDQKDQKAKPKRKSIETVPDLGDLNFDNTEPVNSWGDEAY